MYTRSITAFVIALALVGAAFVVESDALRVGLAIAAVLFIATGVGYEIIAASRSRGRRRRRPPPV